MATSPNFGAILDRQSTEIERPKVLPTGTFVWMVKGQPRFDKSSKKQTEFCEFTVQPLQAQEDVDPDDLQAALTRKDGSTKLLGDMTQRLTFYLTEDAVWRLKQFLTRDLKLEEEDKSLRQLVNEAPGCQFLGNIIHKANDSGDGVFAQIGTTAAVE